MHLFTSRETRGGNAGTLASGLPCTTHVIWHKKASSQLRIFCNIPPSTDTKIYSSTENKGTGRKGVKTNKLEGTNVQGW